MNVSCASCSTEYQIDASKVPKTGGFIRCKTCGERVRIPAPGEAPAAGGAIALAGSGTADAAPAAGIALIVVILLVVWRRRQRDIEQARIIIPPHEWAMGQLAQLSAEDLVGQGRIHEYYFRLSGITREYIERRFSVSAPEMTTEEFLIGVLGARYLDDGQKRALAKFLEACDLVKFAKYQPSSSEIEHAFNAAGDFVSQTAAVARNAVPPARAEVAA